MKRFFVLLVAVCMLFAAMPGAVHAATTEHTHEAVEGWKTDTIYHWNDCSGCDEKLNVGEHNYEEWIVTKEATMYDFGTEESSCTVCGNKVTAPIMPLPGHTHVAKEEFDVDADRHWIACADPDCGKMLNVQPHVFGDWSVTKEATTTEAGSKERVCAICQYKDIEEIPMIEEPTTEEPTTEEPTTEEPSTEEPGHSHDAVDGWKSDADKHWNECSDCEEKLNAADHTFGDWTITKEATTTEAGSKERVCSVCGYKEIGEMPIEVVPDTPPTGDAGSIIRWSLAAMVAFVAAAMVAAMKKYRIAHE